MYLTKKTMMLIAQRYSIARFIVRSSRQSGKTYDIHKDVMLSLGKRIQDLNSRIYRSTIY